MDLTNAVQNTSDQSTTYRKSLLYAHHGWGKTTQMKHFQREYGPGFIISGESGLSSIRRASIDYLPFTSWDGVTDPSKNEYSFKDIFVWVRSDEFKAKDYKWIGVDSLTELADHALRAANAAADTKSKETGKKVDGFAVWGDYSSTMLGVCKAIRDLPMHVIVTALAKESQNNEGENEYWPMVPGKQVQTQLPGIFDCVLCGVRVTTGNAKDGMKVERYIVTDEVRGWHGKVRDENRMLKSIESESDITVLFKRMEEDNPPHQKRTRG